MAAATAFVAGATGYTGREVVRVLAARGLRAVAHVRPDSPRLAEWRERFGAAGAEVDTTPWDEAALAATLRRVPPAAVFALLGTTRARMREAGRGEREAAVGYEEVDYGLTALLLRAAAAAGGRPRFVYLSAAGVRAGAPGAYHRARWKAEEAIRQSGLPYTIARPSFITGPDRDDGRPLERAGAAAVDGALGLLGLLGARRLRDRYRSTTNAVLAEALVRLAFDAAAENRIVESEALRE